jgi:hypothetical protein
LKVAQREEKRDGKGAGSMNGDPHAVHLVRAFSTDIANLRKERYASEKYVIICLCKSVDE